MASAETGSEDKQAKGVVSDEKQQNLGDKDGKGDYSLTKDELEKVGDNPLCPFRRGLDDVSKDNKTVDGDEVEWKNDRPDYAKANAVYLKTKLNNWKAGSLEEVVSNLVKSMEMELTHKTNVKQMVSLDNEVFTYATNGGKPHSASDTLKVGTYNILLQGAKNNSDNKLYDINCSWTESHKKFKQAYPKSGFAWEVLKVYSGPPNVSFKWHHWGKFDGEFNDFKGNGEVIHIYGWATANVKFDKNKNVILNKVDIFFDQEKYLAQMNGKQINHDAEPKEIYQ